MKIKICLLGIFAVAILAIAAPHSWMLKTGGKIEGDYFSSGATTVVVKRDGTNCLIKISDLATNELPYLAEMQLAQRQARLDAETNQMVQAGYIELTANLIEHFPERVRDNQKGWMDVTFDGLTTIHVIDPEVKLGLDVRDKNNDSFFRGIIYKQLNRLEENAPPVPNPLASWTMGLKPGDKIRLIGRCYLDTLSGDSTAQHGYDYAGFLVERIEVIETAAEKKAREDAAENLPSPDSK